MRSSFVLPLLVSGLAVVSCAHPAYGPSADERLEAAVSQRVSQEGADVAGVRCGDLRPSLEESKNSDKAEGDRLRAMTEVFTTAKERAGQLDEAVARNPDLLYSGSADSIKANLEDCRSFYADVRSDLDRFVRDVTELPVIKDVKSREDVMRIEAAVLRSAITALDPDDRDTLLAKVDSAERKVSNSGNRSGKRR